MMLEIESLLAALIHFPYVTCGNSQLHRIQETKYALFGPMHRFARAGVSEVRWLGKLSKISKGLSQESRFV